MSYCQECADLMKQNSNQAVEIERLKESNEAYKTLHTKDAIFFGGAVLERDELKDENERLNETITEYEINESEAE